MQNVYICILFIILAIVFVYIWNYRKRLMRIRHDIKNNWGRHKEHNYNGEELASITSYFKNKKNIVEIKSLKRIIENINGDIPCLCFIDEILRGTNTIERISASSEVLNYISKSNCICISATHDIELTTILDKIYENYHFQENIQDGQIIFDYKLYSGRSKTRNAIKLLNIMGYSSDIVSQAENRANNFIDSGVWDEI